MLMTYWIVGLAFALPELIIVYNWPWLKQRIEQNPIAELVFSLTLSVALATVMGVGVGVTLAVANVMSTLITLAVYHLDLVGKYKRAHASWNATSTQIKTTLREFSELIHMTWKIFMFPIRVLAYIARTLNKGASWLNNHTTKTSVS